MHQTPPQPSPKSRRGSLIFLASPRSRGGTEGGVFDFCKRSNLSLKCSQDRCSIRAVLLPNVRPFELLVRLFELLVRLFELLVRLFELLVRLFELLVRLFEILVRHAGGLI